MKTLPTWIILGNIPSAWFSLHYTTCAVLNCLFIKCSIVFRHDIQSINMRLRKVWCTSPRMHCFPCPPLMHLWSCSNLFPIHNASASSLHAHENIQNMMQNLMTNCIIGFLKYYQNIDIDIDIDIQMKNASVNQGSLFASHFLSCPRPPNGVEALWSCWVSHTASAPNDMCMITQKICGRECSDLVYGLPSMYVAIEK
jgi:hypothetical protein